MRFDSRWTIAVTQLALGGSVLGFTCPGPKRKSTLFESRKPFPHVYTNTYILISLGFGEGGEAFPIYILSFPFLFSLFPRARARAHGPGPRARGAAGPGPGPGPSSPPGMSMGKAKSLCAPRPGGCPSSVLVTTYKRENAAILYSVCIYIWLVPLRPCGECTFV